MFNYTNPIKARARTGEKVLDCFLYEGTDESITKLLEFTGGTLNRGYVDDQAPPNPHVRTAGGGRRKTAVLNFDSVYGPMFKYTLIVRPFNVVLQLSDGVYSSIDMGTFDAMYESVETTEGDEANGEDMG